MEVNINFKCNTKAFKPKPLREIRNILIEIIMARELSDPLEYPFQKVLEDSNGKTIGYMEIIE